MRGNPVETDSERLERAKSELTRMDSAFSCSARDCRSRDYDSFMECRMTYYKMLQEAKGANAREDQLALIKRIRATMAQPVRTRFGIVKRYRDESVRCKLALWLTALKTGHRAEEYWQDVTQQAALSLLISD